MDTPETDPWFTSEFVAPTENRGFDYESQDGQIGLEFKLGTTAVRDLHASALQIAYYLALRPNIRLGCLVTDRDRMSRARVAEEWDRVRSVLKPDLAARLAIVSVGHDGVHVDPPDPRLVRLGQRLQQAAGPDGVLAPRLNLRAARKAGPEEVFRVLLVRWLRRQGPIQIGELAERVGYSRVTTAVAIRLLAARRALNRVPNRPVELSGFPTDLWTELVARERSQPDGWRFMDTSGAPARLDRLLARIVKKGVPGLAYGGVPAARRWCPDLDLNGTPRLDFVLHVPDGTADLSFVERADPALKLASVDHQSPVIVIHPLRRADPLFEPGPGGGLPIADPVETALHLEGLHLPAQAKQVLAHLRPELRYL